MTLRKKKWLTAFVIIILSIGAISSVAYLLMHNKTTQTDPIPAGIKAQVDFPLYYPATLPVEFSFDEITYDSEAGAVIYKYTSGDKYLLFTLQKKGEGIDYNKLRDTQMTEVREVSVPAGQAVMGVLEKQLVSTIFSGNTLIFINATGTSTPQDLETATRSLVPSKR